jgi:conjugal transfer pilus assembly protein TraU
MRQTLLFLLTFLIFSAGEEAKAVCRASIINLVTDTCWECMFPARIGGVQFGGGDGEAPGGTDPAMCFCPNGLRLGLNVAFWEHARLIETVKDPFCFPAIGEQIGGMNRLGGGTNSSAVEATNAFQQVHYYIYPVWSLLNLFGDMPCIEKKPFDIAYISEYDRLWQDDVFSLLINPEAILFGNPVTQLSCMADSAASTVGKPIDPLFWCMGSWGSSYPLSGTTTSSNPTATNALLASRMIFKLGREGLLRDTAVPTTDWGSNCSSEGVLSPIMTKSHYKLQVAKPKKGATSVPIGRSDLIWGSGKNPPFGTASNAPDNFLWIMTRARTCCVGL